MRPNNRTKILDAAVRVAERDGARRLTLEATAEEAGLTRGGMMYHFKDRDALALAMQEHLADLWEARLVEAAGRTAAEASPAERVAAYVAVTTTAATRAELELILDTGHDPVMHAPWARVQQRWTPTAEEALADPAVMRSFLARLAADGLWSFGSLGSETLSPEARQEIAAEIAAWGADTPGDA
jgi:AcrR family transcriptional regulator